MEAPADPIVLPTLAYGVHRECVVYVGGRSMSPSDGDWSEYMRFVERHGERVSPTKALVLERGYGPTVRQRQMLQAATAKFTVRVAILTRSPFTRGITVIVALVKPGYKAFHPEAFDDALAHLSIPQDHAEEFRKVVTALEAKLERLRGQSTRSPLV